VATKGNQQQNFPVGQIVPVKISGRIIGDPEYASQIFPQKFPKCKIGNATFEFLGHSASPNSVYQK
jgi:hypothetical protein